jgi:chromosome partitioning protein
MLPLAIYKNKFLYDKVMAEQMKVLAVIGQKGGSGKTTTTLGLAVQAVKAGRQVAVIDLDPQATAAKWSDRRDDKDSPAVVSCQASRLSQVLQAARAQGVDLAIIDTPAKSSEAAIAAAKVANRVLLPIQPHLFDIETLDSVAEILALAGKPPASVVVNRAPVQGRRHEDARAGLEGKGFDFAPVVLFQRAAHGDAANLGQTASEYEPGGKAALEIAQLYEYIIREL